MPKKNMLYVSCPFRYKQSIGPERCLLSFFKYYYGTLLSKSVSHSFMMKLSPLLIILNVTWGLIFFETLSVEYCRLLLFSFSGFKVEKPAWRKYSLFTLHITHCCMAPTPWTDRSWTPGRS